MNRETEKGSGASFSRHNCTSESMPFRPSTASTATRIRICGVICNTPLTAQEIRESKLPNRLLQCPSVQHEAWHRGSFLLLYGNPVLYSLPVESVPKNPPLALFPSFV